MQQSVFARTVIAFRTELHHQRVPLVLLHVEADRINRSIVRKARAARVSEIAGGLQLLVRQSYVLMTGCRALPFVPVAKRQARAMLPSRKFQP